MPWTSSLPLKGGGEDRADPILAILRLGGPMSPPCSVYEDLQRKRRDRDGLASRLGVPALRPGTGDL